MIQIFPAMDRFIMSSADAVGISLTDYGLPDWPCSAKKESNMANSKNDPLFKKLFKILGQNGAGEIQSYQLG